MHVQSPIEMSDSANCSNCVYDASFKWPNHIDLLSMAILVVNPINVQIKSVLLGIKSVFEHRHF